MFSPNSSHQGQPEDVWQLRLLGELDLVFVKIDGADFHLW
jgi:hypothetical protein